MKLLDVSKWLKAGDNEVSLSEITKTAPGYQVVFRYHVPEAKAQKQEPLSIAIAYDRADLRVGETVKATATVTNRTSQTAPMVMLDLPVPPASRRTRRRSRSWFPTRSSPAIRCSRGGCWCTCGRWRRRSRWCCRIR